MYLLLTPANIAYLQRRCVSTACLQVFYQGGMQANAPGPVNSSSLEVLDLQTLSPFVVASQHVSAGNMSLVSTRYGHQLAPWQNKLLLIGGKYETQAGTAEEDLSVLAFDLSNRTWSHFMQLPKRSQFYSGAFCGVRWGGGCSRQ